MQIQCTWTCRELCFRPSTFSKHLQTNIGNINIGSRRGGGSKSVVATMSAVSTENEVVSNQIDSTQNTQRPLQVCLFSITLIFTQFRSIVLSGFDLN